MKNMNISLAYEVLILCITGIVFALSLNYSDYQLYFKYQMVREIMELPSISSFEAIETQYQNSPRILCRLLDRCFEQKILEAQSQALCDRLIAQSPNHTLSQRLDLFSIVEKWKSFDRKYEKWIIEQGLFYLPADPYFLSRKYLLHYEMSSPTELTSYERTKALAFLENMLRSEERSSQ